MAPRHHQQTTQQPTHDWPSSPACPPMRTSINTGRGCSSDDRLHKIHHNLPSPIGARRSDADVFSRLAAGNFQGCHMTPDLQGWAKWPPLWNQKGCKPSIPVQFVLKNHNQLLRVLLYSEILQSISDVQGCVDPIGSTRRLRHAEGVPRPSYVWSVRPAPPVYNSIGRSARAQAGYSLLS
jgi:hypothetical protein